MTVVRTGTNQKFSEGWEKAFGKVAKSGAIVKKSPKASTGKKSSAGAVAMKSVKAAKPAKKKAKSKGRK